MKSQLIEDFLNLPGIEGIALIDGQSRAYVYGLPTGQNVAQQQLTEGIQQILETTPDTLDSFTFCFQQQQIFLHKVDRGMALLVLATSEVSDNYGKLIAQLTRFMRTDFETVAATLLSVAQPVLVVESGQVVTSPPEQGAGLSSGGYGAAPAVTAPVPQAADRQETPSTVPPTLTEIETALNQLSLFTTQYLGKFIVANHWRNHRPDDRWLTQFQITTTGTISLAEHTAQASELTPSQLAMVQTWVSDFSQRCAKIIRDYPKLARSQALDARQWQLLFGSD